MQDKGFQTILQEITRISAQYQLVNPAIRVRTGQLEQLGLKAMDALHVACASASNSDYFITCDKRLINRAQGLKLKVMNPTDFPHGDRR